MNQKISNIIDELKSLTLIEAAELVKEIEITFNVDASQSSVGSVNITNSNDSQNITNAVEEKTEFDVELINVPAAKKIAILKVVRSLTGLGLKEAKTLVESTPKILKEGLTKEAADDMKEQLEAAGAEISIK